MAEQSNSAPNFFILLGINPDDAWDKNKFEETFKAKKSEWSRKSSGVGPAMMEAKRNLALCPEIERVMADDALRNALAAAARKERQVGQSARIELFQGRLEILSKKGFLENTEVTNLIAEFKDVLSEREIRSRVTVPIRMPDAQAEKSQQQIEPSLLKSINDKLKSLQKNDLYDLLDRPGRTSSQELYKAAQALIEDLRPRMPKTLIITMQAELAGNALSIFKSDDMRHKYDESLRLASLNALLEEFARIVNFGGNEKQKGLYAGQVSAFLERAASAGWSQQEARAKLNEYAKKHSWFLEVPTIEVGNEKQLCGNCKTLNEKGREYCSRCNAQLRFACPDCGQVARSDDVGCGKCGFPVGNRYWVDQLLDYCRELLAQHDMKTADEQLTMAEGAWKPKQADKRIERMREYRAEIQRHAQAQQQRVQQLRDYINTRRFLAAREYLAQLRADAFPDKESYAQTISGEIAQAQALLKLARAAIDTNQKIDLCMQALRICADYKEARDILSTVPPSPPRSLSAKPGDSSVSLQWELSSTRNVSYKIVRKTRSQPVSPGDGQLLATVSGRVYDDTQPEIGIPTYYAVFAALEEITSLDAATLQRPVLLKADVKGVKARIDDHLVELSWQAPPNTHSITVTRKEGTPPSSLHDGTQLTPLDARRLVDRDAQNDRLYFYSIFCAFKDYDGSIVISTGVTVRAMPETPPDTITALNISSQKAASGYDVQLRWPAPRKGQAVILKSTQPTHLKPGDAIASGTLKSFGAVLQGQPGACLDSGAQPGVIYYTLAVILQETAYIGASQRLALIDDVSNLRYQNIGTAIRLNWSWPANCQEVLVAFAYDGYPEPGRATSHARVMRAEYEHRGFYDIRGNPERDHYIVIAAVIRQGNDEVIGSGARIQARLVSKIVLSYEIKPPRKFGPKKRMLSISTRAAGKLPDMLLVSKQGRLPLRREEGEPYFRVPAPLWIESALEFELPDKAFGPKTFGKLYLEDDGLYEVVTIHHPSEEKLRLS